MCLWLLQLLLFNSYEAPRMSNKITYRDVNFFIASFWDRWMRKEGNRNDEYNSTTKRKGEDLFPSFILLPYDYRVSPSRSRKRENSLTFLTPHQQKTFHFVFQNDWLLASFRLFFHRNPHRFSLFLLIILCILEPFPKNSNHYLQLDMLIICRATRFRGSRLLCWGDGGRHFYYTGSDDHFHLAFHSFKNAETVKLIHPFNG